MKQRIRLTESELHRIVEESVNKVLNEVEGYEDTTQKAEKKFNQNTFMGRLRSKLQPKKYRQYQRIQNQGNKMGASATDEINTFLDRIGDDSCNHSDIIVPNYHGYYMQQNPNADKDNKWHYDDGEKQFKKDYANQIARQKKYGTGGRIQKPYGWYNTIDREAYGQQRQAIKNGQM